MLDWSLVVDGVRALVFAAAHLFGNSVGSGILAVSVLVRLALLPLTLRATRRAMEHQARVAALKPDLERLKRKFGDDRAVPRAWHRRGAAGDGRVDARAASRRRGALSSVLARTGPEVGLPLGR